MVRRQPQTPPQNQPGEVRISRRTFGFTLAGTLLAGSIIGGLAGEHFGEMKGIDRGYKAGENAARVTQVYVDKELRSCKNPDVIAVDARGRHELFLEQKGSYTRLEVLQAKERETLDAKARQFLASQPGYQAR